MNHGLRLLGLTTLIALCGLAAFGGESCNPGDNTAPGKITDLHFFYDADAVHHVGLVTGTTQVEPANTRMLAWTATGDDKNKGKAAKYDIRYIKASDLQPGIDGAAWLHTYFGAARQLIGETKPKDDGKFEEMLLPRIDTGDTIWFTMRVEDEVGQESRLSNVAGPVMIKRLTIPAHPAVGVTTAGFSQSVANAHDFNLDAKSDFLVGSPAEGRAYLYPGLSNYWLVGLHLNAAGLYVYRTTSELTPTITYTGTIADEFGAAVAGLGNVNGDHYADIAIGAPNYNGGKGRVYVNYGGFLAYPQTWDQSLLVPIDGETVSDRFGAAVASAGDLNLDSRGDVIVGAPTALGHRGKAYIMNGAWLDLYPKSASNALVKIVGEKAGDSLGAVVAPIGDINGDGVPDVAVAAPDYSWGATATHGGAVYIFYGGLGLMYGHTIDLSPGSTTAVKKADVIIRGSVSNRRFGKSIAAAGVLATHFDLARDLAIAGGDTVYVFIGGPLGVPGFPTASGQLQFRDTDALAQISRPTGEFAAALACPGDLNNDGYSDLLIGAPGEDKVYLFNGPITSTATPLGDAPSEVITGTPGTRFGETLTGVGDFNWDGYVDFLIGAPLAGEAFYNF